jgi:hypothetical protein
LENESVKTILRNDWSLAGLHITSGWSFTPIYPTTSSSGTPPNENTLQLRALSRIPCHIYQPAQKEARIDLVYARNERKKTGIQRRPLVEKAVASLPSFSKKNVTPE